MAKARKDKSFLRGPGIPIVSRPASKEYLESKLWDHFGPTAPKNKEQKDVKKEKKS